jgi:hypothetical protein
MRNKSFIYKGIYGDAMGGRATPPKAGAMQLGCCGRRREITQKRTGATNPRERLPKRRMKATYDDGGLFQGESCGARPSGAGDAFE